MWVKANEDRPANNNKSSFVSGIGSSRMIPEDRNWRNGEPDEVEVEWELRRLSSASSTAAP
jgi:hypothetical protein